MNKFYLFFLGSFMVLETQASEVKSPCAAGTAANAHVEFRGVQTVLPTDHFMHQVWLASYLYPTLAAADQLGIFGAVAEHPQTIEAMSVSLGLNQRALRILLRLFEDMGVVSQSANRFSFTLIGASYLSPKSPFSWKGMFARETNNPIVKDVTAAARAGEGKTDGLEFLLTGSWSQGDITPERATAITAGMHAESAATALLQAEALPLSSIRNLLDVGGGSGCFSIAIAEKNSGVRCTIADLPAVIESAKTYIAQSPAKGRVSTLSLNLFQEDWPRGFDTIFLSNILHDWNIKIIDFILGKAYEALPVGGTIVINEMLAGNLEASAFSVVMLTRTQGQQLTEADLTQHLTRAGFKNIRLVKSASAFHLIVGTK